MSFDSDVALLGTGVAPLIAANHLLVQGKSVLLLNPDWDFFLEDSELPLDPLLQEIPHPTRLARSSPDRALSELRLDYPGPIEFWSANFAQGGYHDPIAPHVRQRGRLWISSLDKDPLWKWEELEDLYVEASDAGYNPSILEGIAAGRKFPGFSSQSENFKGLYIPKFYDVDVVRYRNGLLEFVRERLGTEKIVDAINQVDFIPEGIRFHSKKTQSTAKLNHGLLVFWTPRLSQWVANQCKKMEISPKLPSGVRLWEQWLLNSRDPVDPSVVGIYRNLAVWADFEGAYHPATHPLSVLRAGPLLDIDALNLPQGGMNWAAAESFGSLASLCHEFLKWDQFSIRSLKARALFEWSEEKSWLLSKTDPVVRVIPGCDGPLVDVVRAARSACNHLTEE